MSMPAAPRAPRRSSPKQTHSAVGALVLVLLVLGFAGQCGSTAENGASAPTTAVPTTTLAAPLAEAPQPANNETADIDRIAPAPDALNAPDVPSEQDVASADTDADDSSGSVYYKNCSAARAAGVTPLYAGEPGYSSKLDRDGDGVACE